MDYTNNEVADFSSVTVHSLNDKNAEALLKNKKVGTYLFRKDPQGKVFLSGVNQENSIQHSEIRKEANGWMGMNGGNHRAVDLFALVPKCLHCEKEDCSTIEEQVLVNQ